MARPIVLIPHLFRLADMINFRKDYSPPLVRHLDLTNGLLLAGLKPRLFDKLKNYDGKWIYELPKVV